MDSFDRQSANPQPYWTYGEGLQRGMAEKVTVS